MARRLLLAATGAVALAAAGLGTTTANAAAPAASSAKITTVHSCAKASKGHAQCYAVARTDAAAAAASARMASGAKGGVNPNVTPEWLRPGRPARRLQADRPRRQRRPDRRDRRRLRRPDRRGRPRRLPRAVRPAGVHDRQRLLQQGQPERRHDATRATTAAGRRRSRLDLDMVSAICPSCHILLVEATTAVVRQPRRGGEPGRGHGRHRRSATATAAATPSDATLRRATTTTRASRSRRSTGDSGYGVEYPASSHYVTAVGGTNLRRASNTRGWTETAWSAPAAAARATTPSRPGRPTARLRAGARSPTSRRSPTRPPASRSTTPRRTRAAAAGWCSAAPASSSPIIARVYALAGNAAPAELRRPTRTATPSSLFDVTSGSNGSCRRTKWCHAVRRLGRADRARHAERHRRLLIHRT